MCVLNIFFFSLFAKNRDKRGLLHVMENYFMAIWINRIETTGLFRIEGTSVMYAADLTK